MTARHPMEAAMFPLRQEGGEVAAGRAAMPDTEAPATWAVRLPVLISVANHDVPAARRVAVEELNQMAREADAARAMLAALRKIAEAHVPDQPTSSPVDERTWALQHVARLRSVALGAIALAERGA